MKRFLLFVLLAVFVFSCQNSSKKEANASTETQKQAVSPAKTDSVSTKQLSYNPDTLISKILDQTGYDKQLKSLLERYTALEQKTKLNEQEIWQKIILHDSIIYVLWNITYNVGLDASLIDPYLKPLGIEAINGESGSVIFKTSGNILTPAEVKTCPACAWVYEFNQDFNQTFGEDAQIDDSLLLRCADLGLKLFDSYKNTDYFRYIEDNFYFVISTIAGVYKVNNNCYTNHIYYQDLSNSIDCQIQQKFINQHPNSPIAKTLKKAQKTPMSYLEPEMESPDNPTFIVYAIVVDSCKITEAYKRIFNYLLEGKDVLHKVIVNVEQGKTYLTYRFYADSDIALQVLDEVQATFPDAEMKEITNKTIE